MTCLDNFRTGARRNILNILPHPNFRLLHQCITESIDGEFDEIFNLACPASPPHYQLDPIFTFKTSILGAINVLDLASRCGAKVLQASTSEVYGDPLMHPQMESYLGNVNTLGPRSCYDEGKRGAETLFSDYQKHRGANIRIVRIFNTYGPGMNPEDGRVVSNFIIQALKGEDITIYGDGTQTRSFCYRDDLIEGMIRLMNAPDHVNFPVNIGNPTEFTIQELAEMVLTKIPTRSKLSFKPLPQDDPLQRCPDISRARAHLNWAPRTDLATGLDLTIEYFAELLGIPFRNQSAKMPLTA